MRASDAQRVLHILNLERVSSEVRPLRLDPLLTRVARKHAIDMARRNYFAHESPEGVGPFGRMRRAHYRFQYAGENIALDDSVGAAQERIWQDTPHRDVVLNRHFARVGIGVAHLATSTVVVEDFSD